MLELAIGDSPLEVTLNALIRIVEHEVGIPVRVVGVGEGGPVEWPRAEARVLANLEEEAGQRAVATHREQQP